MRGDFTGFSFDGHHTSDLNIVRVSNGDRYKEEILPEIEDNTLAIPGRDGEFYFGSNYKNKTISIDIAFDRMTEINFRQMQRLFSTKKPCKLIFDEKPYKVYIAKISRPIELNYVCFDEDEFVWETLPDAKGVMGQDFERKKYTEKKYRVYKGEGTIEFVCTYPFAKSQFKTLEQYSMYGNLDEWAEASAILSAADYTAQGIDEVHAVSSDQAGTQEFIGYNAYIPVYNAGDIDVPFYLFLPYTIAGETTYGQLQPQDGKEQILIDMDETSLVINPITARKRMKSENGVIINTNNHLIEGVVYNLDGSWTTTGEVYNNYIVGGDFGKILCTDFNFDPRLRQMIKISCNTGMEAKIAYNYLYY